MFEGDERLSSQSGAILLEWAARDGQHVFEVERSLRSDFSGSRIVYRGALASAYVSGLEGGTHHFRVRAAGGSWSAAKVVDVRYHSMTLVWALFSLGAMVVAATTIVVVQGARSAA